ncbi:MAG: HepT-like ribonuclease domain-containing protein [Planctomycetota bacterium]|jgi:uncharacterized protein with HEPN domain
MRDDAERLRDIQEAIADIQKYARSGREQFAADELIQTWIIHHLLVLGEAAAALSDGFKEQHSDVAWSKIIGMRNILVHHYFGIDLEVVWSVVEKDLPDLHRYVDALL